MTRCSDSVLGSWRITGVTRPPASGHSLQETQALKDVEFCLLECGGVIWRNVVNTDIPLTNFTSFQMYEDRVSWDVYRLIRFSAWRGNIIEFVVENQKSSSPRGMDLSLEGWCTLHCTQIRKNEDESGDFEFNFSVALQQNLYTNQSIKLKNEILEVNEFFVPEKIRLKLECQDPGVVKTVVYYLYNEALPSDVTSDLALKVSQFLESEDLLPGLLQLCKQFSKAVNIRLQFIEIVEDLRTAVNQVLSIFGGRICSPTGQVESGRNKSAGRLVISQPARLAASIRQTSKNVVLVFLKIVQFCVRFEELKCSLTPQEQSLIVNLGKCRLFLLLDQVIELMKALKYATVDLSSQARQDLALYFVEEVEEIATFFTKLGDEFKKLLDSIIEHTAVEREILSSQQEYKDAQHAAANNSNNEKNPGKYSENTEDGNGEEKGEDRRGVDGLSHAYIPKTIKTLRIAMLTKEILSLKRASDQLGYVFTYLKQEKDAFSQQPEQDRIRELSRQLEQLVDEIPLLVLTLERTASSIQDDEMLDECGFLFEFTSQASSVFSVIKFIRQNKDLFQPILDLVRTYCYQDNIEQCLIDMGVVNPPTDPTNQRQESQSTATDAANQKMENSTNHNASTSDVLIELSRKLHCSPKSRDSLLARLGYDLYTSQQDTDMVFELYQDTVPPVQLYISSSGNHSETPCCDDKEGKEEDDNNDNVVRIAAHRVIVCARCAWFQRALASGMKEDRERRIVLRDCEPQVFKLFLQFIYCGLYKLELDDLSVQVLVDLLLVADRYEVPVLVDVCEESLCSRLEEENALPLLVLAEQFNTYRLRKECFEYIAARPDLVTAESVEDLPEHLKQEILGLHSWVRPHMFTTTAASSSSLHHHETADTLLLADSDLLLDSDPDESSSGDPEFNIFS